MIKLNLNENFICRIWEEQSYYSDLETNGGEKVEVIEYGNRNSDSGPDYKNAKVRINNITYSGSIEIHKYTDDWLHHNHKGDGKYNDVILHVAFYKNIYINPVVKKSRIIPTIILSEFLTKSIHEIWKEIINNPSEKFRIPCFNKNSNIFHALKVEWIQKLGRVRLDSKVSRICERLSEISENFSKKIYWEQVVFEYICEALGFSKNKEQFLKLSRCFNIENLKSKNLNEIQIEALLFGTAGFLKDFRYRDEYAEALKKEWRILKQRLNPEIMDKSEWNFFRLRPPNFPTLRIAYASSLLYKIINENFFRQIILTFENSENLVHDLEIIFNKVLTYRYWKSHYKFGKESKSEVSAIGNERIMDIIVNVLLPVVNLYSVMFKKERLKNRTEYFYGKQAQRCSSNEIIRVMENQLDMKIKTISENQGLIHLHNNYCVKGKCSECEIGKIAFRSEEVHEPLNIILY